MLKGNRVEFQYREYRLDPLSVDEITDLLERLGVGAHEVWRRRDRASKALGLTGEETEAELIAHMAEHPTLLQRPIGIAGDRAVIGRPPENLLTLVGD